MKLGEKASKKLRTVGMLMKVPLVSRRANTVLVRQAGGDSPRIQIRSRGEVEIAEGEISRGRSQKLGQL